MSENIATLVRFWAWVSKLCFGNIRALDIAIVRKLSLMLLVRFGKCRDWANASMCWGIILKIYDISLK